MSEVAPQQVLILDEIEGTIEKVLTQRWIIHPGLLAGDQWHVAAAMICDPSVRAIVVVHASIYEIYCNAETHEDFAQAGAKFLSNSTNHEYQEKVKGFKYDKKERKANLDARLITHWQQTLALLELLMQSRIDPNRYWVIPYDPDYKAPDNPYGPAARSVVGASGRQDFQNDWRAHTGDPVVHMNVNDCVGITQSSTSAIVQALHRDVAGTLTLLAANLAPETDAHRRQKVCDLVQKLLSRAAARHVDAEILFVQLRFANENRKHNTTLKQLIRILEIVRTYNETRGGRRYLVQPIGTSVAGKQGKKMMLAELEELKAYESFLLPEFDLFTALDELDGRTSPQLTRRSLIAEFWRQVATRCKAALLGGRSGSVDIGALMGVRSASWDAFIHQRDHMRLCITHQIMGIINYRGEFDENALLLFLAGKRTPPSWLKNIDSERGFRTVYRFENAKQRERLTRAATTRRMPQANSKARGWAILLYDDTKDPWSGLTKAAVFDSLTMQDREQEVK